MLAKFSEITKEANNVASLVLAPGALANIKRVHPPVWSANIDTLKATLPGTILLLKDGSWAVIPNSRAVQVVAATKEVKVRVKVGSDAATTRDADWFKEKVKSAWVAVCSDDSHVGTHGKLTYESMPAQMQAVLDASTFTKVSVSVNGAARRGRYFEMN